MNKSKSAVVGRCSLLLLGVVLCAHAAIQIAAQEQEKKKTPPVQKAVSGAIGGVVGGVVGGTQGQEPGQVRGQVLDGVIRGITKIAFDDDFLLEPRKIVTFVIEHLLVKPTETIALPGKTNLRTELGAGVSYSIRWLEPAEAEAGLEITPTIIDEKGLELKISVLRYGQIIKEEKALASNLEPVIVELFQNETANIKLAEKITPFIQSVEPLQNYPKALDKLEMTGDVLIMNDVMLVNHSRGGILASDSGSEGSPLYPYFWVKGKGVYVLSLWPFPGSKPAGVISDSVIRIRLGHDYFAWFSLRPILPEGKWRVWVRNNPDYDPLQGSLNSIPEKDRERVISIIEKENAAMTGVGGKDSLDKFFKNK